MASVPVPQSVLLSVFFWDAANVKGNLRCFTPVSGIWLKNLKHPRGSLIAARLLKKDDGAFGLRFLFLDPFNVKNERENSLTDRI